MIPSGIRTIADSNGSDALSTLMTGFAPIDQSVEAGALLQIDASIEPVPLDEVQRVIMLAQGGDSFPEQGMQLKQHLLEIERSLIKQALGRAEGNVSKTARLLNLQRTTLIEKINKYGLSETS
jgi:sigma-54 specific flagellar transcriptional regulator A